MVNACDLAPVLTIGWAVVMLSSHALRPPVGWCDLVQRAGTLLVRVFDRRLTGQFDEMIEPYFLVPLDKIDGWIYPADKDAETILEGLAPRRAAALRGLVVEGDGYKLGPAVDLSAAGLKMLPPVPAVNGKHPGYGKSPDAGATF